MIDDYERDGVICVRRVIDMLLVERLREAVVQVLDAPNAMSQNSEGVDSSASTMKARYRQGFNGWEQSEAYREFVFDSAVPRVAAQVMRSKTLRVIYDQTLVKEPGTTVPVKWHHDLPFWPFTGRQICSVWVALDVVTEESGAVHYLRGSHKRRQMYRPPDLDKPELLAMNIANLDLPQAPNYFADPNADLLFWDMEPGDALVFSARTLHGSGANRRNDRFRRAIAPRYAGDDARYVEGMHVLNLSFKQQPALRTGSPLDDPNFPAVQLD